MSYLQILELYKTNRPEKAQQKAEQHFAIANEPKPSEVRTMRIMIVGSFFWLAIFLWWFFHEDRMGHPLLFWPLTIALILKLAMRAYEWYNYFDLRKPHKPELKTKYTVDMLTTACPGEPHWMIIRTLRKMVAVSYPHTTYLCDEGDDPILKAECERLGVIHVTRIEKKNAKAGNINNALEQATGDIAIIMDPDHEPVPEFIDRVLPYFEDEKVGYVQCTQGYYNQPDGFIAKAAAEQTYHFYGPMMMCMHSYGTAQAIGANCAFRRKALDSIGGHAPGLTEDMHTSMRIQSKGWKPVFIPEMLSKGLVPADVSAFYKQQLKWGRGTFDLFIHVLPSLLYNMRWRQRFHHLLSPLYYLSGLVNFINILIPVIALILGEVPWIIDPQPFILFYAPIILMTFFIRQYAQRWVLEKTERGFHLRGGILQMGTWWIYLVSLIYTIFNVKVPYIPTPKEGVMRNNWNLMLPNIVAAVLSGIAIFFGFFKDPSAYTVLMAIFAFINFLFLGFFSLITQDKLMLDLKHFFQKKFHTHPHRNIRINFWKLRQFVYFSFRKAAFLFVIVMIGGLLSFEFYEEDTSLNGLSIDGFYKGVYFPKGNENISLRGIKEWERKTGHRNDIVSFYQAWGPESIDKFPFNKLDNLIIKRGTTPMITWEPWSSTFQEFKNDSLLSKNKGVMKAIAQGRFDFYLEKYALKIKELHGPVFIRFAHEFDNPFYSWSATGGNSPEDFIKAHQYIVDFFALHGVSNVAWVWNPWKSENMDAYYPGDEYVDWVGVTGLNYGFAASDSNWYSFKDLYKPFSEKSKLYKKPVMIAEFGSVSYGGNQKKWIDDAMLSIETDFKEIKSVVFFYSAQDDNWNTTWRPEGRAKVIDWTFKDASTFKVLDKHFNNPYYVKEKIEPHLYELKYNKVDQNRFFKEDSAGIIRWVINGKPTYIKGVAYNSGMDWRNGHMPLTPKTLRKDFRDIKAIGANTIRRYELSDFDENLLKIAAQEELNVIFGFALDHDLDYQKNVTKRNQLEKEILDFVRKHKSNKSIIAWSLGNKTWEQLQYYYSQPYLTVVRRSYIQFVEHLSEEIRAIDQTRPIMSTMEHTRELAGELSDFKQHCKAIDVVGINSFYIENISGLHNIVSRYYPDKPYLVSEFGTSGYWDSKLNHSKVKGVLDEANDKEKARYYGLQWDKFISSDHRHLLGGVAYCWHDRVEGSSTWYGITDYKGRKKPVYYAIREKWTGNKSHPEFPEIAIEFDSEKLEPGNYYPFKAKQIGENIVPVKYEWSLQSADGTEHFPGFIRLLGKEDHITMKVPTVKGTYRLYLYASDKKGNVTTVSYPIVVSKEHQHTKNENAK